MWSAISIDGIDLEFFDPPAARNDGAILLLRGRNAMRWAGDAEWTRHLDELSLRVIAPHRGEGWWFDRRRLDEPRGTTDMQRLLDAVTPLLAARWGIAPPRVALMGVGQGGAAALGLAYRRAQMFPIVAAIQPAIDFHHLVGEGREIDQFFETKEAARQQTAPLHLHPLDWPKRQWIATHPHDPWHEGSERLLSKLDSIGIPCSRVVDDSAPSPDEFLRRQIRPALEFVLQGLRSL